MGAPFKVYQATSPPDAVQEECNALPDSVRTHGGIIPRASILLYGDTTPHHTDTTPPHSTTHSTTRHDTT